MNEKRINLTGLVVCICAAVVIALAAVIAVADEPMAKGKKDAAKCAQVCQKNMEELSSAMMALDEAMKKIDAGDTAGAKAEIEKAKGALADMKKGIEKCMQQMPTVNDHCPISGKPIDRMNTPANLTTMYKGMKVGFCCPNCPPAWDKLTDAEKDAKLAKVMAKEPKEPMMKK